MNTTFLPFLDLRTLTRAVLRRDVVASLAVTFMSVPQCIAYALIAGLPPAAGLYAAIVPTIIGSLFRSSRHVVAGPSNAVSLLVGGILAALSTQIDASPTELALGLALMVGGMQVGAGVLRLGAVVDYISAPVVLGYITGAGVLIGVGQLHNLTGTTGGSGHVLATIYAWTTDLHHLNPTALGLALTAAGTMVAARLFTPKMPAALMGLLISSGISIVFGLDRSVDVVGDLAPVQAALPPLTFPTTVHIEVVVAAVAVTVLSLVESSAVARSIADRTGDRLDLSTEFVGQGLANVAAAFTGGYPVSGSLSRSAINLDAGASSRLSGTLSGVFLAGVLLVAGPLVDGIPVPALAGLLVVIAYDLVKVQQIKETVRAGRGDALAFVATLVGTWTLRLDLAIYLGVALSIVLFLRRARMLRVHELEVGEDGRLREHPGHALSSPGPIRVLHVEGSLFFGAAGELRDALTSVAREHDVEALVVRLKRTGALDVTTARVIGGMARQLREGGRHMVLVGMRPDAMGVLGRTGVAEEVGLDNLFASRPGWFHAMDAGLSRALELTNASADSPLRGYLERRAATGSIPPGTAVSGVKLATSTGNRPPIIGVVGWKNSGKTTLTVRLVEEFTQRGLRVSTVKHAHVRFDVDHPGRDSHRHREAGAQEVAIASPVRWALMHELRGGPEPTLHEMVDRLSPCDLIVVEGYKGGDHLKIEIRRQGSRQQDPIAPHDPAVIGIASDQPSTVNTPLPVFHIDNASAIADLVSDRLLLDV